MLRSTCSIIVGARPAQNAGMNGVVIDGQIEPGDLAVFLLGAMQCNTESEVVVTNGCESPWCVHRNSSAASVIGGIISAKMCKRLT
jgi:hypothetical protein